MKFVGGPEEIKRSFPRRFKLIGEDPKLTGTIFKILLGTDGIFKKLPLFWSHVAFWNVALEKNVFLIQTGSIAVTFYCGRLLSLTQQKSDTWRMSVFTQILCKGPSLWSIVDFSGLA